LILAVVIALVGEAKAGPIPRWDHNSDIGIWNESTHPPRAEVRLNLINAQSTGVESRLQGVCYDLLEKKDKPYYLYLGFGFQSGHLDIEPALGWSFRDNEWVAAFRTYPEWEKWRGYSNCEYQLETKSWYYLAQIETHFNHWVECGAEMEGWGDIDDQLTSNGAGINVVFNTHPRWGNPDSKLRIEAGLQLREMDSKYKPQLIVRFIFSPEMEEHTPDPRRWR
jgi:hypothetical protein